MPMMIFHLGHASLLLFFSFELARLLLGDIQRSCLVLLLSFINKFKECPPACSSCEVQCRIPILHNYCLKLFHVFAVLRMFMAAFVRTWDMLGPVSIIHSIRYHSLYHSQLSFFASKKNVVQKYFFLPKTFETKHFFANKNKFDPKKFETKRILGKTKKIVTTQHTHYYGNTTRLK